MKGLPLREYTDSISLITKMLLDKEISSIKKRTFQKKIFQKLIKSFEPSDLTGKSLFSEKQKDRFIKNKIETPLITLYKNSTDEMKSIINYLDVKNPLFFLQFEKNPKNTRFYSDCLDSIILLIWYNILLTPYLKNDLNIFNDLLSDNKSSDLCEWVLRIDARKLIFSSEIEKLENFNNNLLELGKRKILERINSGHNYKEKFKIIKAVIFKKTLFLTNYEKFSNLSFVRLCIEAAVLSFDIYNKSILIQKEPEKDLKLKSIIINKVLKFKNSFPLLVFVTQEKIEFYLSVLKSEEVENNIDFLGLDEKENSESNYGSNFIDFTKLDEEVEKNEEIDPNSPLEIDREDFFGEKIKDFQKNEDFKEDEVKKNINDLRNNDKEVKTEINKRDFERNNNKEIGKNFIENNFEGENVLEFEKFDNLVEKFDFENKINQNNFGDSKKENNINLENEKFENEKIEIPSLEEKNKNLKCLDFNNDYSNIFEKNIKKNKINTFEKLKRKKRKKNFSLQKTEVRAKPKNKNFNILDLKIENPEIKKEKVVKKYSIKNYSQDMNSKKILKRVKSIRTKTPEILKENKNKILTYDLSNSRNQKNLDKKQIKPILIKRNSNPSSNYTSSFERFKEKTKIKKKDKNILLKKNETILLKNESSLIKKNETILLKKNDNNSSEKKQGIFSYKRDDEKNNVKELIPLVPSLEYAQKPNISKLIKKSSKFISEKIKKENGMILNQDLDETAQYDNICQNLTNLNYLTKIIENSKDISININQNKSPTLENIKKKENFFKSDKILFSKLSNMLDFNKLNSQNLFFCLKKKKKFSSYENNYHNYYRGHSLNTNNTNNNYYNKHHPYSQSPLHFNYKDDVNKSKTISYRNKFNYKDGNFGDVGGLTQYEKMNRNPSFKKKK